MGGALLWTIMFVGAGFFLGNLPVVQHNFTLVVLGIVAVGYAYLPHVASACMHLLLIYGLSHIVCRPILLFKMCFTTFPATEVTKPSSRAAM